MREMTVLVAVFGMIAACSGSDDSQGEKPAAPALDEPANGTAVVAKPIAPASPAPDAATPAADPKADVLDRIAKFLSHDGEDDAFRAGKKTGLGADGETPEVVTEALIMAIAGDSSMASRYVDPARGVYEVVSLPGGRVPKNPDTRTQHCGDDAARALVETATAMTRRQQGGLVDLIYCINDPELIGMAFVPGIRALDPSRYSVCTSTTAAEWASHYALIFVPDETRGVRIVAILESEVGSNREPTFKRQVAKLAKCKG